MLLGCGQVTASCVQGPRELGSRPCKADMAEGAPRHWRQRHEATGEGAFAGLQVMSGFRFACRCAALWGPGLCLGLHRNSPATPLCAQLVADSRMASWSRLVDPSGFPVIRV